MSARGVLAFLVGATLLGAARPAPVPAKAIDVALAQIYGSYLKEDGGAQADWTRPVFTAQTRKLIRTWESHIGEELTGLNDYGWFCECQDWDFKSFAWKRGEVKVLAAGRIEVAVHLTLGWGAEADQRLVMVRGNGRWLVEDLFSDTVSDGIRAGLREEIAEIPAGQP